MPRPLPYNSNPPGQAAQAPRPAQPFVPPAPEPVVPAYNPPRQHGGIGFGQILIILVFIGGLFVLFSGIGSSGPAQPYSDSSSVSISSNANSATVPLNSSSDNCSPATIFSVGRTVVADASGQRLIAWTQPGGNVQDSEAEPGMGISIVGGPQCIYNNRYSQYVRYWQVEFTNRNGRFVSGWVAESIWEGSSLNYLICPPSNSDC